MPAAPVITPNVLAPGSGDYNLDGLGYDIPLAATRISPAAIAARHTCTDCLALQTSDSQRKEQRALSRVISIATRVCSRQMQAS